jgi:hypothetical protein
MATEVGDLRKFDVDTSRIQSNLKRHDVKLTGVKSDTKKYDFDTAKFKAPLKKYDVDTARVKSDLGKYDAKLGGADITDEATFVDVKKVFETSKGTGGQIFDAKGGMNAMFQYLKEEGLFSKVIPTLKARGVLCKDVGDTLSVKPPASIATIQSLSVEQKRGG